MIGDLEKADAIAAKAGTYEGVEDVKYYKNTVDKLLKATHFIQITAVIIIMFLIIVSIVVVSNTIKLTVINRSGRDKYHEVCRCNELVHTGPFLFEGIVIGVVSAGISVFLLHLCTAKHLIGESGLSGTRHAYGSCGISHI